MTGLEWTLALCRRRGFSEYNLYGYFQRNEPAHAAQHFATMQLPCASYWEYDALDAQAVRDLFRGAREHQVAFSVNSASAHAGRCHSSGAFVASQVGPPWAQQRGTRRKKTLNWVDEAPHAAGGEEKLRHDRSTAEPGREDCRRQSVADQPGARDQAAERGPAHPTKNSRSMRVASLPLQKWRNNSQRGVVRERGVVSNTWASSAQANCGRPAAAEEEI